MLTSFLKWRVPLASCLFFGHVNVYEARTLVIADCKTTTDLTLSPICWDSSYVQITNTQIRSPYHTRTKSAYICTHTHTLTLTHTRTHARTHARAHTRTHAHTHIKSLYTLSGKYRPRSYFSHSDAFFIKINKTLKGICLICGFYLPYHTSVRSMSHNNSVYTYTRKHIKQIMHAQVFTNTQPCTKNCNVGTHTYTCKHTHSRTHTNINMWN